MTKKFLKEVGQIEDITLPNIETLLTRHQLKKKYKIDFVFTKFS